MHKVRAADLHFISQVLIIRTVNDICTRIASCHFIVVKWLLGRRFVVSNSRDKRTAAL